jgi:hypothetical protein
VYKKITLLACIISISLVGSVFARNQTYTQWTGTEGGDWSTASNWSNSVPLQLDTPGVLADPFGKAGFKNPPTNNSPGITAGVTVATDQIVIGSAGGGTLTVSGGTINVSEFVNIGNTATDKGTLNMNSGTLNCGTMISADGRLIVGSSGQGTINMNSGVINLTSYLSIADLAGSIGNVHLDGGTIYATDLLMNTASAHLDIRGGTLILDGNDIATIDGFVSSGKISAYDGIAGSEVRRDYNVTNPGKTTVTGYLPSPKAINPTPFNTATNVALDANLSWTAGLGAASHNVYFGTDSTPDETEFQGNQPETTFDPCTLLAPATIYYWRIDEVNEANIVTTGDVWSFTTISGQPSSPNPANYATDVAIHPILSWTPGQGALSHDVYFGTDSTPDETEFQGNQIETTFDPCNLLPNTIYYWRIDEVYSTSTVTGPVWSFTTANTKATIGVSQFCPRDGATGMPIGGIITLAWNPGVDAVSHDVYFGTVSPGEFQGNQSGTYFSPPVLDPNTTYYWRIDEKDDSNGTTTGDVWSFTTGDPVGTYPYLTWRSDPTNSIVVSWWNPAATGDSSVDYGLTDTYGSTANVPAVVNYHHVEVTGLSPATTYHYRVRSSDGTTGSDNTFTTAEVNTTSFSFAMYGDPRGTATADEPYYTRQGALCDWILAQDFDFAVETGDTAWEGASLKAIGKWWPDFFRIEGNLTKSKVVMHTLGNHEVQGGGSYYYWNDFYTSAFPDTNSSIPGNNGRVYSFDYGNVHFVNLSTYQVNLVQQKNWLIADLTAAKARPNIKWIFVFFHAPMFTNSGHPNRTDCIEAWGPTFDQFGVNAVFQGHNHVYERSYPLNVILDQGIWTGEVVPDGEGTVYVTNGMGGAEFNNTSTTPLIAVGFGASNLNTTVVVSFTINGSSPVIVEAIRNDTGAVIDTFELMPRMLVSDFNKDGVIDMKDLGILVGSWLDTGMWP